MTRPRCSPRPTRPPRSASRRPTTWAGWRSGRWTGTRRAAGRPAGYRNARRSASSRWTSPGSSPPTRADGNLNPLRQCVRAAAAAGPRSAGALVGHLLEGGSPALVHARETPLPYGARMRLTEREQERRLITLAADVAERRRGRGLKLNHPEALPWQPRGRPR